MTERENDPQDIAEKFVNRCLAAWIGLGLPVADAANAFAMKGLQLMAYAAGPEETAAGLERLATGIRLQAAALDDTTKH